MLATKREKYPRRWRMFLLGAAPVVMVAIAAALALRITDPEELIPLAISTVFYAVIVGFLLKAKRVRKTYSRAD